MNVNLLYETIGVDRNASNQQINQAYLKSIQDNQHNPEKIELTNASYQVLTNPKLRQIYDSKGLDGLNDIESETNNKTNDTDDKIIDDFYQKEKNQKNEENTIDNLLYDTLKISRNATLTDIQNAYEREYILITSSVDLLMKIDLQKIQLLNAAYNVLSNPEIRKVYDKSGIAGVNKMQEEIQENEKNQRKFADDILYEILGVNRFADSEEIRLSYLNLLKNADYSDKERIKMIHSAYSVLSVPKIRKVYDDEGIEGINKNFTTIQFDEKYFKQTNKSQNETKNEKSNSNSNNNENRKSNSNNNNNEYEKSNSIFENGKSNSNDVNEKSNSNDVNEKSNSIFENEKYNSNFENEKYNSNNVNEKSNSIFENEKSGSNCVDNENYENLLYETLGIERDASIAQIKFAYNRKMKAVMQKYGFINDESEEVQLIKASFNVLSNPKLRSVYDKSGIAGINQLQSEENQESNENENSFNSNSNSTDHSNSKSKNESAASCSNSKNKNACSLGNDVAKSAEKNVSDDNILYDAIGVKRSASFIEIQMAFLKKLNETVNDDDSEKSQLLHAAYNVLSDPELREIYDCGGLGAINKVYEERARKSETEKKESKSKDDVFVTQTKTEQTVLEDFDTDTDSDSNIPNFEYEKDPFNISDDEELNENDTHSPNSYKNNDEDLNDEKTAPIENLELTLEQLYNGCKITKTLQIEIFCPHCKGTGNEYGKPFPKCPVCNGSGQKIERIEKPANFLTSNFSHSANQKKTFDMKRICEKCMGRGELRADYSTCCVCYGLKKFKSDFDVEIEIKPGTSDGDVIKIPLKIEKDSGELIYVYFKIIQKKHDLFEKVGNDLIYLKKINLAQSLCGNLKFPIKTLDKRTIIVNGTDNEVIQPNSSFVVKNEGFPIKNEESGEFWKVKKGDLIVKFIVELPSVFTLGPKVINMLKAIQPLNCTQINYDRNKILKEKLYFYQLPYETVS